MRVCQIAVVMEVQAQRLLVGHFRPTRIEARAHTMLGGLAHCGSLREGALWKAAGLGDSMQLRRVWKRISAGGQVMDIGWNAKDAIDDRTKSE